MTHDAQSTAGAELEELADRWLYLAQHPSEEPLHDYARGVWQAEIDTYTQCADELHELVKTLRKEPTHG